MSQLRNVVVLALLCCINNVFATVAQEVVVGFGSCLKEDRPMPVWGAIAARDPAAFILMGDNTYPDRASDPLPDGFKLAYQKLASNDEFATFRTAAAKTDMPLLATWDDHDYGLNDGGRENPYAKEAKAAFVDFFGDAGLAEPDSQQAGVYSVHYLAISDDLRLQVILLDTRSFRDPLGVTGDIAQCKLGQQIYHPTADATVLGERQWLWLAEQLRQPADVRLIVSSIQVLPTQQCFEKWANFPRERQRLFQLIASTGAEGVVLLSGDRHHGEIMHYDVPPLSYPLYEVTASGLNSTFGNRFGALHEPNQYRLGNSVVVEDHFGELLFFKERDQWQLSMRLLSATGQLMQEQGVPLALLR